MSESSEAPGDTDPIDAASAETRSAARPRRASPWRGLTRRAFVAMLGTAAAALAVPGRSDLLGELASDELAQARARRRRRTAGRKTIWIGHC
jgi:hypothetical protein